MKKIQQLCAATTLLFVLTASALVFDDEVMDWIIDALHQSHSSEKRKLLNFVCSNSTWKDQTLTGTFRQPFDVLALTNTTWQKKAAGGTSSSDLVLNGGPYGTIFATFSYRQRQKCSVSCNSCEVSHKGETIDRNEAW